MPRVKHHRSSRRVPPPKDSDFDHEINLVDHAPSPSTSTQDGDSLRSPSRASSAAGPSSEHRREQPDTTAAEARTPNGDAVATPDAAIPKGDDHPSSAPNNPLVQVQEPTPLATERPESPDLSPAPIPKPAPKKPTPPESEIDILYENQRGGFLCGVPLFSSKALGNLDPPPWTNFAHKPSPTDITNAQVPDPSWEWAWPEWRINHDDGMDEDGWEYSFMFAKKFSWHKARWWNSFVRRRAWTRKRVRKDKDRGYSLEGGMESNRLDPGYFSVRQSVEAERSPSRTGGSVRGSVISSMNGADIIPPEIETVEELLAVLRASRIDREKIEAVENYLEHAKDELNGLGGVMHEIMTVFVFQASRRALLSKLTDVYDKACAERERRGKHMDGSSGEGEGEGEDELQRRVGNLAEAVKHADEEVKKLEYWSDVKMVVTEGDSKGAVDGNQGWEDGWTGLDRSGAKAPRVDGKGGK
ncbi:hypothetical protein B0T16DRAFT_449697 [Cercophora newfieldiana]|uniref:Meiotically up-regulated 65 protein n=1 Tax=Cercophora newfieldiana TaxID=92897 RepID=A0AA39XSY6_9PEZI|nr:hypothetical protein B0T16DRAFT_449697 [Cercophora newfieldiana]